MMKNVEMQWQATTDGKKNNHETYFDFKIQTLCFGCPIRVS